MPLEVKNPPVNAGDLRDAGSIPGLGGSPGEGNGNLLQYSCLENPMDRRAWSATVHGVTQNQTRLKRLSMDEHSDEEIYRVRARRVLRADFYGGFIM